MTFDVPVNTICPHDDICWIFLFHFFHFTTNVFVLKLCHLCLSTIRNNLVGSDTWLCAWLQFFYTLMSSRMQDVYRVCVNIPLHWYLQNTSYVIDVFAVIMVSWPPDYQESIGYKFVSLYWYGFAPATKLEPVNFLLIDVEETEMKSVASSCQMCYK